MSDRRLRELERRYAESNSKEDRKAYAVARKRSGLPKLPRLVIRHYVAVESHGHCDVQGEFDIRCDFTGGWPIRADTINAACSVELWPRNRLSAARGWAQTLKEVFYTEDVEEVTCKTCVKSINNPKKRIYKRAHYVPGSKQASRKSGVNEVVAIPVCGRDDSKRFEQSYFYTMTNVTCPACRRIMYGGRRRPRVKARVPGPLGVLPGGNFPV